MELSRRAAAIAPSSTMAIDTLAKTMAREGLDVVGFGVGEPDFDTPAHIKEEAMRAIREGFTKYTAVGGIPELKEAICEKFRRDNGLHYSPDQVIVSVGAKHCCYNAFQVLCDPGDEVIIPSPYWVSYEEQVRLAGGQPVIVPTSEDEGFKLQPDTLRRHLTSRSRVLVLNSPSNPTGAVYGRGELEALAAAVLDHPSLVVLSDEIYEPFVYDGREHVSIASLGPEIQARTVVVHGVSKTYAMTGWRIGYAAGDTRLIAAMADLQSHATSNPTSIAQRAAVAALTGPQDPVREMTAAFAERRRYVLERVGRLAGVRCLPPDGAFYVFPRIDAAFGRVVGGRTLTTSAELAETLLKETRVALVPGSAFGAEGYLRISYATSLENLAKGLDRIEAFWQKLA